ncbi:MAG: hypothetical protein Q8936_02325 [Bacillota bacterium]|nr:hypothetical protein [Bacillota bacterium]
MAFISNGIYRWRARVMIQQHYYTRERRGLYSEVPGYDTIAKSENLSDTFIKNTLHPLCFYDSPSELVAKSIQDIEEYPKSLVCANLVSGEMILGSTAFIGADYTGKRNTFFTHNYVIPVDKRENFIADVDKLLCLNGFNYSYDIDNGSKLEEVDDISIDKKQYISHDTEELIEKLGIDENIFKKLLYACFISSAKNKKIYIALDTSPSKISIYAKELLRFLLRGLPFELRRRLGFITYMREPKSKKFINIAFVEKGSLKETNPEVSAGFIFDFSQNNIKCSGFNDSDFLNFIWSNLNNEILLNSFFQELDIIYSASKTHSEDKKKIPIDKYDILCNLFLMRAEKIREVELESKIIKNSIQSKNKISYLGECCEYLKEASRIYPKAKELKTRLYRYILDEIELSMVTKEDILNISLGEPEDYNNEPIKNSYYEKYKVIIYMKGMLSAAVEISTLENEFLKLSDKSQDIVLGMIRRYFKNNLNAENYRKLLIGLNTKNDFYEIVQFIYENAGTDTVRNFIIWTSDNLELLNESSQMEAFKETVRDYFRDYDKEAFNDRKTSEELFSIKNSHIKSLLRDIQIDSSNGIRKLYLKTIKSIGGR